MTQFIVLACTSLTLLSARQLLCSVDRRQHLDASELIENDTCGAIYG
jgi:hypothetical protein